MKHEIATISPEEIPDEGEVVRLKPVYDSLREPGRDREFEQVYSRSMYLTETGEPFAAEGFVLMENVPMVRNSATYAAGRERMASAGYSISETVLDASRSAGQSSFICLFSG